MWRTRRPPPGVRRSDTGAARAPHPIYDVFHGSGRAREARAGSPGRMATITKRPVPQVDDGIWSIYFCRVLLARLDERDYIIRY